MWSDWTTAEVEKLLKEFETSVHGLSSAQAAKRLKQFGRNEVVGHVHSAWTLVVQQMRSPFNYLLILAALIAFVAGQWHNGLLILTLSIINVGLGFYQEFKAHRALLELRTFLQLEVRALRDGKEVFLKKALLVPGDIIIVEPGEIIPADARVIQEQSILVDEAILTGESRPIFKKADALASKTTSIFSAANILFAGTTVVSGYARAVIVATGDKVAMNAIVGKPLEEIRVSTYEKSLVNLSNILLRIVLVVIAVVFALRLLFHGAGSLTDLLIFFIALVVALVPVALPTVISFSLSQAAVLLARKQVIVKRLSAIEDLGDLEILCADKTGTLTEYELTVDAVFSSDKEKCLLFGFLNDTNQTLQAKKGSRSVFQDALLTHVGPKIRSTAAQFSIISTQPFDPRHMFMSLLVATQAGEHICIVRGAPDVVLQRSSQFVGEISLKKAQEEIQAQGKLGKRIIAIAFKKVAQETQAPTDIAGLTFLGFITFINPIKKGVVETLALAKKLGVSVKMITGDSAEVAGFVAHQVGLIASPDDVIKGSDLEAASTEECARLCQQKTVFARIDPTMKARIIGSLQEHAEVGFLGEGINDVPALRKANVALVVKEATDVAREAADIILLQPDIHVMINGIRYGRVIFANISKYIKCSLSSSFGNYYSVALFSLILPFLPLLPTQLLLINILSDFPLIAIASDTVDHKELITPKSYQLRQTILLIVILGFIGTFTDFIFLNFFHECSQEKFRTCWFMFNIFSAISLIFSVRAPRFFLRARFPSIPLLVTSLVSLSIAIVLPLSSLGHQWLSFVTPSAQDYLLLLGLLGIYFALSETAKLIFVRHAST